MTSTEASSEAPNKRTINLLRGWPSPDVLPAEALKAAANKVLSDANIYIPGLQYGPNPGYQPLREELSSFLAKQYGVQPDAERICISGGASQSMACILQSYTEPVYTKAVWLVAPCYHLACSIFEDSGFRGRLKAVPQDGGGIDLEWLRKGLEAFEADMDPDEVPALKKPALRKIYRHIIYAVPTAANPSGKTMTPQKREALVRLARTYDCLVICDDVYDFLQWPVTGESSLTPPVTPPAEVKILPRLSDIDFALGPSAHDRSQPDGRWFGHAISNGTFSKIVGPGVRTGWVEGTRDFAFGLAQTGSTKSGGAPSQLSAAILSEVVKSGELARHIEEDCRPNLMRRHALFLESVHKHLDRFGIEVLDSNATEGGGQGVFGGYFLWVTFPRGPPAQAIAERALGDEGLVVAPGHMFEVRGDEAAAPFPNSVRLCFSWEDEQHLLDGVVRLARVVAALWGAGVSGAQWGGGGGKLDAFF